jgi:FdhD protein
MSTLARRPGPSVRTRVTQHTDAGARAHEDRLATEEPLEIRMAAPGGPGERVWVTMRTPGHDFELAVGFAVNESMVAPSGIVRVAYCTDADLDPEQEFNVVTITVAGATDIGHRHVAQSAGSSACGVCGKDSVAAVLDVRSAERWPGAIPSPDVIRGLPAAMRERQTLFDRTGGVHAAALTDEDGRLLVVREDVGRHNAVDKVIGARVLVGEPRSAACLVVSGRAGFELVQKAVASGIGSLVAVGAPTSLSVRLANESGLALFGFTGPRRCVQYA